MHPDLIPAVPMPQPPASKVPPLPSSWPTSTPFQTACTLLVWIFGILTIISFFDAIISIVSVIEAQNHRKDMVEIRALAAWSQLKEMAFLALAWAFAKWLAISDPRTRPNA